MRRAHVMPFEALKKPEPPKWMYTCDCCHKVWSSENDGMKKLEEERAKYAAMPPNVRAREDEKYSADHLAQHRDHEPLLPVHFVVFDPMHAMHTEVNCLLDEAIHQHLIVESPDEEVMAILPAHGARV